MSWLTVESSGPRGTLHARRRFHFWLTAYQPTVPFPRIIEAGLVSGQLLTYRPQCEAALRKAQYRCGRFPSSVCHPPIGIVCLGAEPAAMTCPKRLARQMQERDFRDRRRSEVDAASD